MVVFKRKTRMVSFRLSDEEFQILRSIAESKGARSVSDYARDTLCHISQTARQHPPAIQIRMDLLASELALLNREVQSLRIVQPAPLTPSAQPEPELAPEPESESAVITIR